MKLLVLSALALTCSPPRRRPTGIVIVDDGRRAPAVARSALTIASASAASARRSSPRRSCSSKPRAGCRSTIRAERYVPGAGPSPAAQPARPHERDQQPRRGARASSRLAAAARRRPPSCWRSRNRCRRSTGFHYSNTNYVLLGLAVERVTGTPARAAELGAPASSSRSGSSARAYDEGPRVRGVVHGCAERHRRDRAEHELGGRVRRDCVSTARDVARFYGALDRLPDAQAARGDAHVGGRTASACSGSGSAAGRGLGAQWRRAGLLHQRLHPRRAHRRGARQPATRPTSEPRAALARRPLCAREERGAKPPARSASCPSSRSPRPWTSRARPSTRSRRSATRRRCPWRSRSPATSKRPWKRCSMSTHELTEPAGSCRSSACSWAP